MNPTTYIILSIAVLAVNPAPVSANEIAHLREGTAIDKENPEPHRLTDPMDMNKRQIRAYPMQPPIIPHHINNYQIDKNANKCLGCHARTRTGDSNAPMVSVTHFMNRDGNFLADVSPRRYFCLQCHIPQKNTSPAVKNNFIQMHQINQKLEEE